MTGRGYSGPATRSLVLGLAALLALAGCGGTEEQSQQTGANESSAQKENRSAIDGQWSGTTSQGTKITFTVSNGTLTEMSVKGKYGGADCPVVSVENTGPENVQVVDRRFRRGGEGNGYLVEGTFDSDSTASGKAHFVPDKAQLSRCKAIIATWKATKSG